MITPTHRKKYVLARRIDDARCMAVFTPFAIMGAFVAALVGDKEWLFVCLLLTIISSVINVYLSLKIEEQISRNITEAEKIGEIIEF
jgi:uncharacterized membrane protein YfcA